MGQRCIRQSSLKSTNELKFPEISKYITISSKKMNEKVSSDKNVYKQNDLYVGTVLLLFQP